jgi:hypothetical protein
LLKTAIISWEGGGRDGIFLIVTIPAIAAFFITGRQVLHRFIFEIGSIIIVVVFIIIQIPI